MCCLGSCLRPSTQVLSLRWGNLWDDSRASWHGSRDCVGSHLRVEEFAGGLAQLRMELVYGGPLLLEEVINIQGLIAIGHIHLR